MPANQTLSSSYTPGLHLIWGIVQFDLRCAQCVNGIIADPQSDWSFDELISELNTIDRKLQASSPVPLHLTKTHSSDNVDSDSESTSGAQWSLMDKGGVIEGALIELSHEHQLSVAEEIRARISAFGADITNEKANFTHALSRAEKNKEARRELDRKRDLQYQRQIAEELDNHLTEVQRHHEYKSQIEEKKIRDDAAIEEAKRKQKAFQEEKIRQEKIKAEEARHQAEKKKEEEAKAKAFEAEKAAKEAAAMAVAESQRKAAEALTASQGAVSKESASNRLNNAPGGNVLKGAESALKMEESRLKIYNEVIGNGFALEMDSNHEYKKQGMQMARRIKTITGTKESVRSKAEELVKLMNATLPQSVNLGIFADKVVYFCTNASSNAAIYAYGHVIVMVTSQTAFESRDAYLRAIGYQEENGKLESTDDYVARLTQYMKLYGALLQTEVNGIQNPHGIEEGWKWLARFLNALPANIYTIVALEAFLEVAGFALYRRYKNQFKKLLDIISRDFLKALKESKDPKVTKAVMSLESYIQSNKFQKEPEGWRLRDHLQSSDFNAESDNQQQYNNSSQGYGGYQQQYNYNSPNRFVYRR
ncbi:hypothetical protein M8C21_029585 [Ambrosia artemisiifolia]|uniref:mRNA export factor GLE1 n=1 Tax=Ambrosia artemisiifolia TaxID=4212 RepID=A0AAD5CJ90_AMBAR|nr:hypothetical protein M8C21_029585 [Ambrosia artemisiifolia]